VHEIGRKHGIDSISMDSSEDQAEHAGLNTSKTLPSKHKKIYEERPKRAGYYLVPKEEIFGKAPHLNEIHRRVTELWPEDEVDDDGRPLGDVTPRWLDDVKGPQWNENSKIQF